MVSAVRAKSGSAPMHRIEAAEPPDRFARGWHCLGAASDYKDGKPHSLEIFGTRLVAYRDSSSRVNILDAWCPHMGADLALGHVEGDNLVCRFHGWQWGPEGKCEEIPYCKRIPPKARIRSWPTCEENKLLFVWHDPEGNPPPKEVTIPRIEQCFSDEWSDWHIAQWDIHTNCRELVDNQADMAHFEPVHGSENVVYFANLFEGHKVTQIMVGKNERLGGPNSYLTTIATYFGPAYHITHMFGEAHGMPVESILLNTHVPVDKHGFQLRFGVMVKRNPSLSANDNERMIKEYVDLTNKAFAEDVDIWHNKVRVDNPLLCEGDGPINQLRQWYEQFYMDADKVPAERRMRKVVENDKGILKEKPPLAHVFEA